MKFKEFFTPKHSLTKLGALKFTPNIFKDEQRTPHYEMDKAIELYLTRPVINSGVKQIARFVIGDKIRIESTDEKTHSFLNNWLEQRKHLRNEIFNMVITGIVAGNVALERVWRQTTNKSWILDNIFNINDISRVYINLDAKNDDEFYLFEVPIEMRAFKFGEEVKTPKFYRINYVRGSYMFHKMVWAVPVHKSKIAYQKLGWSRDGIYGRSFLASAIDDGEILNEIVKNYSVIARYRALGKKIFTIGSPEDPADLDDIERLEEDLRSLRDEEHIVINKPLKSEPLTYTGENDPMDAQLDFLRRDITSGLVPNFLSAWLEDTNRATAQQIMIPFSLEINSIRSDVIDFLNRTVINELRKQYSWLAEDASFSFGKLNLESKEERMNYAMQMFQSNAITLNELREAAGFEPIDNGDIFLKDLTPQQTYGLGESFKKKIIFSEQLSPEDEGFLNWLKRERKLKEVSQLRRNNIGGRIIRLIKSKDGYYVFDGRIELKFFTEEEKKAAETYFEVVVENKKKALDKYLDVKLPEHNIIDEVFEQIKRLNAEVIDEVFDELNKKTNRKKVESLLKEKITLDPDMLPSINKIFKKFDSKVNDIVNKAISKLLGVNLEGETLLGDDVKANPEAREELMQKARIIKQRMKLQLKTMNRKMQTDVFRILSDGIAANRKIGDIKQELKDKYVNYKTKENPQDWQIDRVVRTELSNANGLFKLLKWKKMGFTKYEWLTMEDEKVRPEHAKRNRRIFKIDDALEGRDIYPGKEINCRCSALPYE